MHPAHGGNLAWAATLAGCSPQEILDFSASISPLGPPNSAIVALHDHLSHLQHYPDPEYWELRQALAAAHALSPAWILPGNGAAELLIWASRELAQLSEVCLVTPAFSLYQRALQSVAACVFTYPLLNSQVWQGAVDLQTPVLDLRVLLSERTVELPDNGLGLLLNNPHNPSGLVFSRESILACLDRFALVVVDEAFMDFLPPERSHSLIDAVTDFPNLIVVRSLTKFYSLPGLRLGYVITHPDRLRRWQQWRDPWSVNCLAAAAGAVMVQDRAFQQQTWNWLAQCQPPFREGLAAQAGLYPFPSAVNFFLVHLDTSVTQLQRSLLQQHHLLIRDCLSFPELGDRYFRVAVRTQPENQRLLAALSEVLTTLPS